MGVLARLQGVPKFLHTGCLKKYAGCPKSIQGVPESIQGAPKIQGVPTKSVIYRVSLQKIIVKNRVSPPKSDIYRVPSQKNCGQKEGVPTKK